MEASQGEKHKRDVLYPENGNVDLLHDVRHHFKAGETLETKTNRYNSGQNIELDTLHYEVEEDQPLVDGPGVLLSIESLEELQRPSKIWEEMCSCFPKKTMKEVADLSMGHGQIEWVRDNDAQNLNLNVTLDQAKEIAQHVVEDFDDFLDCYFHCHKLTPKRPFNRSEASADSLISNPSLSDTFGHSYIDEPSTMDLFYEQCETKFRDVPLKKLSSTLRAHAECQVHLHRKKKQQDQGLKYLKKTDKKTQTKLMTFVNRLEAERIYRHAYPLPDHYVAPAPPLPSRQPSLEAHVGIAETAYKNVDSVNVGPKVKWGKKMRRLPPLLPQDYHKVESFWTGSKFTGRYVTRQFAHGLFDYPLMSSYASEFHNGQIQSKHHTGLVVYPRGDKFEGIWKGGRNIVRRITFADGLKFKADNWKYCIDPDRRFYIEQDIGVRQAGDTLYNDRLPPPKIPAGCYDVGEGFFDPCTGEIKTYTGGVTLRKADGGEIDWIIDNCWKSFEIEERHKSCFNENRLPCSYVEKCCT